MNNSTNETPTVVDVPNGTPNRRSLKVIAHFLSTQEILQTAKLWPDKYEPQMVTAQLKSTHLPKQVSSTCLEIYWFEDDDFFITYEEDGRQIYHWIRDRPNHVETTYYEAENNQTVSTFQVPEPHTRLSWHHPIDIISRLLSIIQDSDSSTID